MSALAQQNLDGSSQAERTETKSISVDHNLEGGNLISNGLASPGLECVLNADSEGMETYCIAKARDSTEKEVCRRNPTEKEVCSPSAIEDDKEVAHQALEQKKTTPWLFFSTAAIVCLIIGLAIGLGVGLTRKGYGV